MFLPDRTYIISEISLVDFSETSVVRQDQDIKDLPFAHVFVSDALSNSLCLWIGATLNRVFNFSDIVSSSISITRLFSTPTQVALVIKNLSTNAGDIRDVDSISGLGRSPGEGNGTPLQYSCLENPMDSGAWRAVVHGVTKSRTRQND